MIGGGKIHKLGNTKIQKIQKKKHKKGGQWRKGIALNNWRRKSSSREIFWL